MNFARQFKYVVFPLFIFFFLTLDTHAAGEVDPGFNASAQFISNGSVNDIAQQSDGKVLVGGRFTVLNGNAVNSLVRLNSDGSADSLFNVPVPDFFRDSSVTSIAVQPDGKILMGVTSPAFRTTIKRLNPDGSFDTAFSDITFQSADYIYDIKIQPDGKFLAAGAMVYQTVYKNLIRFNADGTRDTSFTTSNLEVSIREAVIAPGGRILIGGLSDNSNGFLFRLNSDGTTDLTFPNVAINGAVEDIELPTDGKIIIGGAFQTVRGVTKSGIARLNGDGTFDSSFNPSGFGANGTVNKIAATSDGKFFIGGSFTTYNNFTGYTKVARINADGSLDSSFISQLNRSDLNVTSIGFLANGKILVGCAGVSVNIYVPNGLTALNANGLIDTTLPYNISRLSYVKEILRQPDGKLIIGGDFDLVNNTQRLDIARLNADGTLDPTFTSGLVNDSITALALQSDGKILVGLGNSLSRLKRLNADGSLDTDFFDSITGAINDIVALPDGKILVGGSISTSRGITRLKADGSLDSTFSASSNPTNVFKILVQPDGRILTGFSGGIQRLSANGIVDTSFSTTAIGNVYDIAMQPDGKLIVGGSFTSFNNDQSKRNIVRLTPEGFIDGSFTTTSDGFISKIAIQPDRKILIGGQMAYVNGIFRTGFARLNVDGTLDATFTANTDDVVTDFFLLDNKIIVGGVFTKVNGTSRVTIARLNNNIAPQKTPFDFDGDGRTDVVVYRPSNSVWYQLLGVNYQFSSAGFGIAEDIVAPADYDGDGKTDLAVFRPSTGVWWYRSSAQGNAFRAVQWGQSGDVPLPSDFNGDGKDDFVVYRPSNNTWYRLTDSGVSSIIAFGIANDKPVIGDFDGDGKSDIAIFRPSTGVWWYAASSANNAFRAVQFGASGDVPAAADFDGDRRTDIAVFRPSNGGWYILNSGNGSTTITQFGTSGDKPVAGDYDGDGKGDIAVYRPSNGSWYISRSTAGFIGIQFGINTDIPIPNAFQQ